MEINLFTNNNPIGYELSDALKSGRFNSFKMAVAYAKTSGVGRLYDDLSVFATNGGKIEAIIGIDQNITSYQALINLSTFTKENLFIHHDKGAITYHPKVYMFGNEQVEKVLIGSSNLTAGGLYSNFEANIGVELDSSEKSDKFRNDIQDYWNFLRRDPNTKAADQDFIDLLLTSGNVADETIKRSFKEIIGETTGLPFTSRKIIKRTPPINEHTVSIAPNFSSTFAMTLSNFDVSISSQDPVQLIPTGALKMFPTFWNFPTFYTESNKGYPQMYAVANILIDGKTYSNVYFRIYYYEKKKEFRLQCELIKRNGNAGDIMIIEKDIKKPMDFKIKLIRQGTTTHTNLTPLLLNKAGSSNKKYGYF